MATIQRKLVHKQFNSPIGLYSDENVKETLDRELRAISNGAVGIETSDQHRPVNLANSAVLKMLEEQEGERFSGYRRVAWPPVSEGSPVKGSTPQPQYQPQYQGQQGQNHFDRGQSPGIIHLRKEAPISQKPAPIVTSQPAAKRLQGGSKMRGDLKWPPPEVKAQMAAEEEHKRSLSVGPAFRPTRPQKDYTQFFAKHALNSTYPGYKIPPGTQHMYVEY